MKKMLKILSMSLIPVATLLPIACGTIRTPIEMNTDKLMEEIYQKLKTFPGNDHPTYKNFEEFEKEIEKRFASLSDGTDKNLKSEIIDILNTELESSLKQVKDEIDKKHDTNFDFIKTQLSEYATSVEEFTENLKYGIIGVHDLNQYSEILDDKVDHSIFASSATELDAKISNIDDLHKNLKTNIDKNLLDIEELKKSQEGIKDIETDINNIIQSIKDNKTLIAGVTTATGNNKAIIDSLVPVYADITKKLEQSIKDLATHKSDYDTWKNNQSVSMADFQDKFKGFVDEFEKIHSLVENLTTTTENSFNALSASDVTLKAEVDKIRAKVEDVETGVEELHDKFIPFEEKQNQLIKDNVQNQDELARLSSLVKGLTSQSDQLDVKLNTNSNTLKILKSALDALDLTAVHKKIDDNKEIILSYSQSIDQVTSNIATIIEDIDKIIKRADANEIRLYNLEELVKTINSNGTNPNVISEYETLYNTGPKLLGNKMYLSRDINDYAKIDIVMMPVHAMNLSQVVSFAPEKNKKSGVIQYRGNGAFNGWLMSLLVDFDYNENSITVKTIQLHGWGNWVAGSKLQAIRGWLY